MYMDRRTDKDTDFRNLTVNFLNFNAKNYFFGLSVPLREQSFSSSVLIMATGMQLTHTMLYTVICVCIER